MCIFYCISITLIVFYFVKFMLTFTLFCFACLNNSVFYASVDECEDDEEEVSIANRDC